jgi:hypothetical protein
MNYFVIATPIILSVVFCIVALNEDYSAPIYNLLDTTIFNKFSTSSGMERSSWNRQALQVFIDTYGFGAGNGSMRTSSFPLAVIANLGIIGGLLFSLFFLGLFFGTSGDGKSDPLEDATRLAAKSACMAWLVTASISGALTDLGMPFFAFAAIACARPSRAYSNNAIDNRKYGGRETPRNIVNIASGKLSGWH